MKGRIANFSAGPAVLPESVLLEAQENLLNYKGHGLSVMEMSHRSKVYQGIIDDAMDRAKRIMELGDDYEVLFLGGGASMQFLMLPMNLCPDGKEANYINTGVWSTKAIKECKKIGKGCNVAATSEDKSFTYIPKEFTLSANPAYLHYTTNNTIMGTEYKYTPEVGDIPLISDMSSNFLSKPLPFNKHALIYAGAQKNIGPAGVTMVVIRKDMLEKLNSGLPTMLSYKTHADKGSMFNTPPCFPIYIVGLMLKWIEDNGGLVAVEQHNIKKAGLIYDVIDNSEFYRSPVNPEDRSLMNIVFRLPSEDLEKKFIAESAAAGMSNLKGHRDVGGCRASTYNALPIEACQQLRDFMIEFEKNNG